MKSRFALLFATTLLGTPLFAGERVAAEAPKPSPSLNTKNNRALSGSFSAGYETNYQGRGIVASHSVVEGDSSEFAALRLDYDIGQPGKWSLGEQIAYRTASSGHTLYGNPMANGVAAMNPLTGSPMTYAQLGAMTKSAQGVAMLRALGVPDSQISQLRQFQSGRVKNMANIENEFSLTTTVKYTSTYWNVAFGHDFIHGGILGVMAKHYRDQGASCVNEFFVTPEWTPAPWFSLNCTTRFSCQGITGWWFEPSATFRAPIIGSPQDPKLLGMLTFALSATADYFESEYFACQNGTQAFWIKLATPYFVTDDFIVTPSVSFNWLGKGGLKANEKSEFRLYSGNDSNVPFRNFGVVGGIMCTYRF